VNQRSGGDQGGGDGVGGCRGKEKSLIRQGKQKREKRVNQGYFRSLGGKTKKFVSKASLEEKRLAGGKGGARMSMMSGCGEHGRQ